jgi:acetyl-CoA acetyltransferase
VTDLSRTPIYVVGAAETPLGEVRDHSELSMVAVAAREALGQAGMTLKDVDGVFVNYMGEEGSIQVGEYLGIRPRYADSSDLGGGSFEAFIHHAFLAIAAGRCEVALIAFASRQRTKKGRSGVLRAPSDSLASQLELPHGLPMPIGQYALIAARHMHQFGTTPEQLASVAVQARQWAMKNPAAWSRDPLTVEDVLASRMICDPLHKLDCCLITDGGGVVIVTNQARARDAAARPIRVLGAGESTTHWNIAQMGDMTVTPGAISAREAFGMAGITPADVHVLEPYDAFTICVLLHLEDLGFCRTGEGGPFAASGALGPGGRLPSMTSGGGLSHNHPGALGIQLLVECVRQLRWEAGERQVPGATIGVAHGMGGFFSACATVVLARE